MPDRNGVRLDAQQADLLARLDADEFLGHLLISEDERISYLALAETRLRSAVGHALETPDYAERRAEVAALFAPGGVRPELGGPPPGGGSATGGRGSGPSRRGPRRVGARVAWSSAKFQILQFAERPDARNSITARRNGRRAVTPAAKTGFDDRAIRAYCGME